ncbi:MAG: class I adenylate-forming enzyme family protein, partial [Thermoleophilaceae bacterium]
MEVTDASRTERPPGLGASTMTEAFQATAQAHPQRVALRTKDDEFSMTWGEYADKVRSLSAGLAALGLERGEALGIMLTNRPEFHFVDSAALHLGATPFSVYNTYTGEQIAYQVNDAGARIVVTEKAFLDRVQAAQGIEHLIVVDAGDLDEALTIADV